MSDLCERSWFVSLCSARDRAVEELPKLAAPDGTIAVPIHALSCALDSLADTAATIERQAALIAEAKRAMVPFAELSKWITENHPHRDHDYSEVQIEGWPYTLSVGWLRRARAFLARLEAGV